MKRQWLVGLVTLLAPLLVVITPFGVGSCSSKGGDAPCSSGSTFGSCSNTASGAPTALSCLDNPNDPRTTQSCGCQAPTDGRPANEQNCSDASGDVLCVALRNPFSTDPIYDRCFCSAYRCGSDHFCTYNEYETSTGDSDCTGAHHCVNGSSCFCKTACSSGDTEVTSCSDPATKQLLREGYIANLEIKGGTQTSVLQVHDCRAFLLGQ